MEKFLKYWLIILLAAIVLGGLFYWYEWRPISIIKNCERSARITESENMGLISYETAYKGCLRFFGLNK